MQPQRSGRSPGRSRRTLSSQLTGLPKPLTLEQLLDSSLLSGFIPAFVRCGYEDAQLMLSLGPEDITHMITAVQQACSQMGRPLSSGRAVLIENQIQRKQRENGVPTPVLCETVDELLAPPHLQRYIVPMKAQGYGELSLVLSLDHFQLAQMLQRVSQAIYQQSQGEISMPQGHEVQIMSRVRVQVALHIERQRRNMALQRASSVQQSLPPNNTQSLPPNNTQSLPPPNNTQSLPPPNNAQSLPNSSGGPQQQLSQTQMQGGVGGRVAGNMGVPGQHNAMQNSANYPQNTGNVSNNTANAGAGGVSVQHGWQGVQGQPQHMTGAHMDTQSATNPHVSGPNGMQRGNQPGGMTQGTYTQAGGPQTQGFRSQQFQNQQQHPQYMQQQQVQRQQRPQPHNPQYPNMQGVAQNSQASFPNRQVSEPQLQRPDLRAGGQFTGTHGHVRSGSMGTASGAPSGPTGNQHLRARSLVVSGSGAPSRVAGVSGNAGGANVNNTPGRLAPLTPGRLAPLTQVRMFPKKNKSPGGVNALRAQRTTILHAAPDTQNMRDGAHPVGRQGAMGMVVGGGAGMLGAVNTSPDPRRPTGPVNSTSLGGIDPAAPLTSPRNSAGNPYVGAIGSSGPLSNVNVHAPHQTSGSTFASPSHHGKNTSPHLGGRSLSGLSGGVEANTGGVQGPQAQSMVPVLQTADGKPILPRLPIGPNGVVQAHPRNPDNTAAPDANADGVARHLGNAPYPQSGGPEDNGAVSPLSARRARFRQQADSHRRRRRPGSNPFRRALCPTIHWAVCLGLAVVLLLVAVFMLILLHNLEEDSTGGTDNEGTWSMVQAFMIMGFVGSGVFSVCCVFVWLRNPQMRGESCADQCQTCGPDGCCGDCSEACSCIQERPQCCPQDCCQMDCDCNCRDACPTCSCQDFFNCGGGNLCGDTGGMCDGCREECANMSCDCDCCPDCGDNGCCVTCYKIMCCQCKIAV